VAEARRTGVPPVRQRDRRDACPTGLPPWEIHAVDERSALSDDDRAMLIAYLDGELDEDTSRKVESRLTQDPTLRAEADSLRRTWELLDYLPKVEVSPSFTHRTLACLPAGQTTLLVSIRRTWLFGMAWAGAVLVALVVGFATVAWLLPHEASDDELVRDLRLIENKRMYEQVDGLDFLRELDHPDLFGDNSL